MKRPLEVIPTIGPRMARALENIGIFTVEDLRGRDPEELYRLECLNKGFQEDRCALYAYRLAVYYAEHETRDAEKLKWWYWKDRPYPAPQEENDP